MNARERIAWAVDVVRETRSIEKAHAETRVTSDVIRKACKEAGVHYMGAEDHARDRNATKSKTSIHAALSHAGKRATGQLTASRDEEHKLMRLRGWKASYLETDIAVAELGLKKGRDY